MRPGQRLRRLRLRKSRPRKDACSSSSTFRVSGSCAALMFGTTRGKASAKMSAARAVVFLQAAAFLFYAADTLYMLPGPDPFAKYFGIGGLYGTYAPSRHLCDFSALNVAALALGAVLVGVSYSEAAVRRFCLVLMTHNLAVLAFLVGMGTNTNSGGAYEPSEFGAAFGVTAACAALGFWASRGPLPEPRLRVRSSLDALCLLWAAVDLGTVFKSMVLRGGPEVSRVDWSGVRRAAGSRADTRPAPGHLGRPGLVRR